jgi:hypothetical protein
LYRSVHDKLVKVSDAEPQQPNIPISGSSMKSQKKINEEFEELFEAKKPTALDKFRAAAAEREKKHDEIEAKRKEAAAQGKENMSGAIDRLEKQVNKEEVEQVNEISVDSASNYIKKRTFGYVKTMKGQVQPSDVYNKMSDKHKAGISRAMDRVVKPVKEEVKLNHKHLLKDTSGKVRTFMLRRSAAKEAHINGGVVHKMGNGYVIKIKENEDAKSTNQLFENQTNSIAMRGQTSRSSEGGRASEERNCQEGYNTGKITLSQIRSKKEKVSESIDRGIEPGLSMAQSGENFSRPAGEKLNKKGRVVTELTGDETTASIGDQKEDELKKKGIDLLSFRKRNYAL